MTGLQLESELELEIKRLVALQPSDLSQKIQISPTADIAEIIQTQRDTLDKFVIKIEPEQWQQLSVHQRNLLFWHEIAQVQRHGFSHQPWEMSGIILGLSFGLLELLSLQNPLSLAISLAITGFSFYYLYQRRWGEHSLRSRTAADQCAIQIAVQAGYTPTQAYNHLSSALRYLSKQAKKSAPKHYLVRLNVLEMPDTR